ncbi:M15 family metallopeptidase [Brumimicrobium mesophilum]|uniref:M15 family metallopeptidase n=1 Tax=Brumimicrobium mesophilum TaxID=392717 RepID=UPI0018FE934B|nr:M15 family metallopeptidase [Brumimicrobium mesophilum]
MIKKLSPLLLVFFLFACKAENSAEQLSESSNSESNDIWIDKENMADTSDLKATIENVTIVKSDLEKRMIKAGLVDIQSVDSSLKVDVKYATTDNFMDKVLYDGYDKVYLQPIVAERLSKAQKALQKIDSTLTLLVFDGTRPRSVQQEMWDALDSIPFNDRVKFVSNPVNGSIHNYGCAVDLTIINKYSGGWLDMGAEYDDLRKIAYPRHEAKFLASGELTQLQVDNRKLLRKVMRAGGFWVIETEWWHFNAFSRTKANEMFEIVE